MSIANGPYLFQWDGKEYNTGYVNSTFYHRDVSKMPAHERGLYFITDMRVDRNECGFHSEHHFTGNGSGLDYDSDYCYNMKWLIKLKVKEVL